MPRAQIKDEKTYQALRREGNSEEKLGPDCQRGRGELAQEGGPEGRKEPVLRRLVQGGPGQARPRARRQGPLDA